MQSKIEAEIPAFEAQCFYVYSVSSDGKYAIGYEYKDFYLVDLTTRHIRQCAKIECNSPDMCFTPDNQKFIILADRTIYIFETATGILLLTVKTGVYVTAITVSPDNKSIIFVSNDLKNTCLYKCDINTGIITKRAESKMPIYRNICYSPDGLSVICSGDDLIEVDMYTGDILRKLYTEPVRAARVTLNGKYIIMTREKFLHVLDYKTGKELGKMELDSDFFDFSIMKNGNIVLQGGHTLKMIRFWFQLDAWFQAVN